MCSPFRRSTQDITKSFNAEHLLDFQNALDAYQKAYYAEIERLLTERVLILEDGRMPSKEEIARRGKRVIYPSGKIEWYWDSTMILLEKEAYRHDGAGF